MGLQRPAWGEFLCLLLPSQHAHTHTYNGPTPVSWAVVAYESRTSSHQVGPKRLSPERSSMSFPFFFEHVST